MLSRKQNVATIKAKIAIFAFGRRCGYLMDRKQRLQNERSATQLGYAKQFREGYWLGLSEYLENR